MVSFQAILSPKNLHHHNKTISYLDTSPLLRKRKSDDDHGRPRHSPMEPSIASSTIDLHLETPLPSEWQRCLNIQSGEIHFYNTKTKKRTISDPRGSDTKTPSTKTMMSLELELNLPCGDQPKKRSKKATDDCNTKSNNQAGLSLFCSTPEGVVVDKEQQEEMVAAACKRCHMLVVLCKSSPACPNCKFMHPPQQQQEQPTLPKPTLGLIC